MTQTHTSNPDAYDYTIYYRHWNVSSPEQLQRQVLSIVDELRPLLPAPSEQPVIDVGCGSGSAIMALQSYGFRNASGIEVDRGQVEECVRRGLKVERTLDSIEYLKQRPSTYALVLIRDVLEHVPPIAQIEFCRAICGALVPGGRVIVQVPNSNNPVAMRWRYGDYTHHASFTEHSLEFVLANAGFTDIRIPASPPLGMPPLAVWKRSFPGALRRWLVRFAWKQVLAAELGGDAFVKDLCLELNMRAVAFRPKG